MVVGEIAESTDLLIIGGGPGGYAAAVRGAQAGRTVTLVDEVSWGQLGGTCLNVGCIPSKALIHAAEGVHAVAAGAKFGLQGQVQLDLGIFQKWKDDLLGRLGRNVAGLMKRHSVTVVEGRARFNRPNQVVVEREDQPPRFIQFADVIVATGSRPATLPNLPIDHVRVMDSSDVLGLSDLPETVTIVGAGVIGLELGTALAKIGSSVSIVDALPELLPHVSRQVARVQAKALDRLGIRLILDAKVESLTPDGLVVRQDNEVLTLATDIVVVAVGRVPNTDDLGLGILGVEPNLGGYLEVNASCLVKAGVAAIGDVTPGPALAHRAVAQAAVAVDALAGGEATFDPYALPWAIFSDPEVAGVGINKEGVSGDVVVKAFSVSGGVSGRATSLDQTDAQLRLYVDVENDQIVGAEMIGPQASELINEIGLAIEMGAAPEDVASTIHVHPSLSELLVEVSDLAAGTPLHAS